MRSVKYLQKLQEVRGLSDAGAAKLLRLTPAAISQYKSGKRVMDDETCLAVAIELDIAPIEIIGAACMDRAEKTGQHSLWEVFMSRTANAASAMMALLFVNFILTTTDANAAPSPMKATSTQEAGTLYYVKYDGRTETIYIV